MWQEGVENAIPAKAHNFALFAQFYKAFAKIFYLIIEEKMEDL